MKDNIIRTESIITSSPSYCVRFNASWLYFQDDGLIFLWVTGRAMELGRECLKLWGYERVDELIWVKTNQLQRIIRTGRNALIYYILTV